MAPGVEGLAVPDSPAGIEWLICRKADADRLEFLKDDAVIACLDFRRPRFDLPNLLAIFVIGDKAGCLALRERWNELFPSVSLDFRYLSESSQQAWNHSALACLAARLTQERKLSGKAAVDLAIYRQEFERLQRSFSHLESYVSQHLARDPVVLFEYAGVDSGARPLRTGDGRSGEIEPRQILQRLPVDSLGVSGIGLYIRHRPPVGAALRVRLQALENDRCYGEWAVDSPEAAPGWLHLSLSHAIDEAALTLVVVIEVAAELDLSALLGVGQPHPYEEFRACSGDGEILEAPLALRIYGALPGMRVPGSTGALRPTDAARAPVTRVAREMYQTVRQIFPPRDEQSSTFVSYDQTLGFITVHPHESGTMTVARLDLVAPAGAWRLSAQVALEHELANPVDFGLLALPRMANTEETHFSRHLSEDSTSFSGWLGVTALQKKRLSVFLPSGTERGLSVYLLTRQAPEASADFAWARFSAFEFNAPPGPQAQDGLPWRACDPPVRHAQTHAAGITTDAALG